MTGDPRIVWRYSIEYSSPTDDCTVTRAGRARAYTEDAVEDWLVSDLTKKYGDDFTVVECRIWRASNEDNTNAPIVFSAPIKQSTIPPCISACPLPQPKPEKKQEEKAIVQTSLNWFELYAVTPGLGLGGSHPKQDKFYASVKEATSL